MRAAPDPRILTGWSGASPHVLRFPPRAFLRFPVCPPGSPPSPAFPWFPFVRRSPVRRLRPLPGSGSPAGVPAGFPFLGNHHDSAAAGRFRRRWSRAARAKVTSPAATTPAPGSRRDLVRATPMGSAGHDRMPLQNRLLRATASAGHRRTRTTRNGGSGARGHRDLVTERDWQRVAPDAICRRFYPLGSAGSGGGRRSRVYRARPGEAGAGCPCRGEPAVKPRGASPAAPGQVPAVADIRHPPCRRGPR